MTHPKIIGLFLFILAATPLAIATEQWECIGPDGGSFIGAVSDPADPDHLISVMTYPSPCAVYRTTDGGADWTKVGHIPETHLYGFAAFDMNRLYAIASNGAYFSKDGGATWSFGTFPLTAGIGFCLSADPVDPNVVHAAGFDYVSSVNKLVYFKSMDGGASWTGQFIADGYVVPYDVAVSKTDPNIRYIAGYKQNGGSYTAAMYRTIDGGVNWSEISSNVDTLPNYYLFAAAVDPLDSNKVYAAGHSFYRSMDGGVTWSKVSTYFYNCNAMALDPSNPSRIYLAGDHNVYMSQDAGLTWNAVLDVYEGISSTMTVADPSTLFVAAIDGGIFKSTDNGVTWNGAQGGISTLNIASLAVAPSKPETVFLDIFEEYKLMATYNSGDTLQDLTYPNGCSGTVCDLLFHSQDADKVIALEAG